MGRNYVQKGKLTSNMFIIKVSKLHGVDTMT